jgi:16S rRNA (cytidine1402-2'-O)-methyltransferase
MSAGADNAVAGAEGGDVKADATAMHDDAGRGSVRLGGQLVLAGTPLGRPSDASEGLRAALVGADVIAAEDTRRTRRLASDLGVELTARLVSYYDAVERSRIPGLVERIRDGETVVLVTDAGMPSVSDPGYRLVSAVAAAGLRVTSVPGPSAAITALALSGLPSDRFCFEGFLPRKQGERARALQALSAEARTMVFFESVHRVADTLSAMVTAFGPDRPAALCREITKTHEEVRRGTLADLSAGSADLRGEITLVVAGASQVGPDGLDADPATLAAEVADEVGRGSSRRDAVDIVAARHGLARRVVYAAATSGPSV